MSPWDILGWLCVGLVALPLALVAVLAVAVLAIRVWQWGTNYTRSLRDRRVPPAAGQVWLQDGARLLIDRIADNGRIVIRSGAVSWSDSPEEWRGRVRGRRLRLVRHAP